MNNDRITAGNAELFAFVNSAALSKDKPVREIVVDFHGLGETAVIKKCSEEAVRYGEAGILYTIPYYGPWSWMNEGAVSYVDELIDALREKYSAWDAPLVSRGNSMGGLSSIIYTLYSKQKIAACAANCPVCDLVYHYNERADVPRTLYKAYNSFDGTLEEALRAHSPLHMAKNLPDIPYYVVHGTADGEVNKSMHSDKFVAEMKLHHNITYIEVPGMAHCMISGEYKDNFIAFTESFAK